MFRIFRPVIVALFMIMPSVAQMFRMFKVAMITLLMSTFGMAQNPSGAMMPWSTLNFFNVSGVLAVNGKLCTYLGGTTTPYDTWVTSDVTSTGTKNANPIRMGSDGRPTTNGIFIDAHVYKFVMRTAGTDGTCATGTIIWTYDGAFDKAQLNTLVFATQMDDKVCHASQFTTTTPNDWGGKVKACHDALPGTGGVIDPRGLEGAQVVSVELIISKQNVSIIGDHAATVACLAAANCVTLTGTGDVLSKITFTESLAFPAVVVGADYVTVDDVSVSGTTPGGSEGAPLAAIMLAKGSKLVGVKVMNCNVSGTMNGGIYADATIPLGVKNLELLRNNISVAFFGIIIGPYGTGPVSENINVDGNYVEVKNVTTPNSFEFSRATQFINVLNGLRLNNNFFRGGFGCVETFADPRSPGRHNGLVINNMICDSFMSLTQWDSGSVTGVTIDMALRDPSWIKYDNPVVVAAWGYAPGLELADNTNVSFSGSSIRNAIGELADFGNCFGCGFTNNVLRNSGMTTVQTGANIHAHCINLTYNSTDIVVTGNDISGCWMDGISQTTRESFSNVQRANISNNVIKDVQRNGIRLHNTAGPIVVAGNTVTASNLTSGPYDSIHYSLDGVAGSITGVTTQTNITSGGRYGVFSDYAAGADARTMSFKDNTVLAATTAGFYVYGHTSKNWSPVMATGMVVTLSAATGGHVDVTAAADIMFFEDPGVPQQMAFIDNGNNGDIKTFVFPPGNNITVVNQFERLELNGSINVIPTGGSTITFICGQDAVGTAQKWVEISRMIR